MGALALGAQAVAADIAPDPLARDIFKQLIEINTSLSVGSTTAAAQAMAQRLLDGGFAAGDVQVLAGPNPKRGNLVARLHGSGAHKPMLIIGHLDVVEARREDWTTDPFVFTEKDGYFYGRGTQDMKDADAIAVASFIRLKKEG
ncbi:MAG: M20/M25/M40 family metallo-hydrolase, partial [Nevskiales bacterium]